MRRLIFIVLLLIPYLSLAQDLWETTTKHFTVVPDADLSLTKDGDTYIMAALKAQTSEQKRTNWIPDVWGTINIVGFPFTERTVKQKMRLDIEDINNDPSHYNYRTYDSRGKEVLYDIIYWGVKIGLLGTNGTHYNVFCYFVNYGSKSSFMGYRSAGKRVNVSGYYPGRSSFETGWETYYGQLPSYVEIVFDDQDYCDVSIGYSSTCHFGMKGIKSVEYVKFDIGPGAKIRVGDLIYCTETLYSKVKKDIDSGDSKVKNKDYWGAAAEYSKAIDAGYKNYDIYYKRASAYYSAEFFNNAIDDYSSALSYKQTEDAYLYRGLAKLNRNDMSGLEDLKKGGSQGKALVREFETEMSPGDNSQKSKYYASGTGFFIDPRGFIATNYHVVESAKGIDVFVTKNGKTSTFSAKSVVVDKQNDLAIIKVEDDRFSKLMPVPYVMGSGTKDVGTSVFAMGYPELSYLGEEIKVTDGIISSKTGFQGDITTYQISAPIQHGNSGGPLFDNNGYLVGITNAGVTELQNVGYAIKVSYLNNLIEACPEAIYTATTNQLSGLSFTEKIKKISPYVVIIKIY